MATIAPGHAPPIKAASDLPPSFDQAQFKDFIRMAEIRLLIVNDSGELGINVASYLEKENISVGSVRGREGLAVQTKELVPGLVLLFHSPQRARGFDLLKDIRKHSDVPIIMIAAAGTDEADRVVGLELGADDCMTVPFGLRELLARIRAVLRRNEIRCEVPDRSLTSVVYQFSGWQLHQRTRRLVNPLGSPVPLSRKEYALLMAFVTAPGRMLSREQLINATRVNDDVLDRTVDVLVYRLRRKLNSDPSASPIIVSERGYGYRFCASVKRVAFK